MARLAFLLLVATSATISAGLGLPHSVVSSSLLETLHNEGTADIAIILKSDVSTIYDQVSESGLVFHGRGSRMTVIRSALIEFTTQTQGSIRALLDSRGVTYTAFWITNRIIVPGADAELVRELSTLSEVAEIREQIVVPLEPLTRSRPDVKVEDLQQLPVARGVFIVGGRDLWEAGFTGEGMVTSNIDTGVRGTHRILRDNFRGEYGWFDPGAGTAEPNDQNGHGTHTMGTIAGREGFGVAPDSQWMACIGCAGFGCSESDLIGCGEWIACPTRTDGSAANCSYAPHVVGNSWGSTQGGDSWYDDVITGWHAAEVIPIFSAGNAGAGCGSVGSPGDRPGVISVAATDMEDVIADFSSRGPATGTSDLKPEMSAPGVDVLSSVNGGDDAFDWYSGTSMASPHVTGGIALLIQRNPALVGDYDAIRAAIFAGAETEGLTGTSQNCGGVDDTIFPNLVFGHGRLDLVGASANFSSSRK